MTRAEIRRQKKLCDKDFSRFCKIIHKVLPELSNYLSQVADPRKGKFYEMQQMLGTILMKNICSIESMQGMTNQFNDAEGICAENLCKALGLEPTEFLPHYVTINTLLKKLELKELETLRNRLVYDLLRSRRFEGARFQKKWLVIVDATGLFHFRERHCEHCLKTTKNKGKPEEATYYYHHVLEARIVLGEKMQVSIGTEFIENEKEDVEKQDCETKAFKRLAKKIKRAYPHLPICILADSLYASEPVFSLCRENKWNYIIRYKEGSITSIAEEYRAVMQMGEGEKKEKEEERKYKRRKRENIKYGMSWVSELEYKGHSLTVMELEIEIEKEGKKEKEIKRFQWLTNMRITGKTAWEFAQTGRKRWKIENDCFNVQKNIRYDIQHANSLDYNGMKCHYILTQIADILM